MATTSKNVINDAKRIFNSLLSIAISQGDFQVVSFSRDDIMRSLQIQDLNYFKLCLYFLDDKKYIQYIRQDDNLILTTILPDGIIFAAE